MKKARFFYIHECNKAKLDKLESLHSAYVEYVGICVNTMLEKHTLSLKLFEIKGFFPEDKKLLTQYQTIAKINAIGIMKSWAKNKYSQKMKSYIYKIFKEKLITKEQEIQLFTIGKYLISKPQDKYSITQENIDLYWKYLLDEKIAGKVPNISDKLPIMFDVNTAKFRNAKNKLCPFWIRISTLSIGDRIDIPLRGNSFTKYNSELMNGFSARKDKLGRWRFEALERRECEITKPETDCYIGIDSGLNAIATTSDGRIFNTRFKASFDRLYNKIKDIRSNRQRQNLKTNSKRLDTLELKLSNMTKTEVNKVAKDIVKIYPNTIFVVEDLNLKGCRGQKRFAYLALQKALAGLAYLEYVNPAYTSQCCPDCEYLNKLNRKGKVFCCRSCGSKRNADCVGSINILKRFEDKNINTDDNISSIKTILRNRYLVRRTKSRFLEGENKWIFPDVELTPCSQELTTELINSDISTVPNYSKLMLGR